MREAASRIDWAECPCLTEGQIRRVEGILALSGELGEDEWAEMVGERDLAVRESTPRGDEQVQIWIRYQQR